MKKTICVSGALLACVAHVNAQPPTFTMPDQDPVATLCRQLNGSSQSAIARCIEETKKQGVHAEEDSAERLRYRAEAAAARINSDDFIRRQLANDESRGYQNMMIEDYAQNVESLKRGKKVAVAGQLKTPSVIADFSGQRIAYVSVEKASVNVRKRVLAILQSPVGIQGGPTPVVLLGRVGTCTKYSMGVDAGPIPCLGVDDIWSMSDSPGSWSFDQMRTMQPIKDAIER